MYFCLSLYIYIYIYTHLHMIYIHRAVDGVSAGMRRSRVALSGGKSVVSCPILDLSPSLFLSHSLSLYIYMYTYTHQTYNDDNNKS